MKALKLLLMDRHELGNPKIVTTEMFNEAIAELEALQKPKNCNGCKHVFFGMNSCGSTMDCKKGFRCSRAVKDEFEPNDEPKIKITKSLAISIINK